MMMDGRSPVDVVRVLQEMRKHASCWHRLLSFVRKTRDVSKLCWLLLILDVIVGLAVSKGHTQKYTDKLMGTSVADA
jgi:hypothetical protein